jgi:hypothetical protein
VVISLFFLREALLEIFSQRSPRYAVARPEVKGEGISRLRSCSGSGRKPILRHESISKHRWRASMITLTMAGIYALQTQREFIGGPYPYSDFASAWDGVAFGKALDTFAPRELARYLDLYNVKWMLCHSSACTSAMSALPDAAQVAMIGPVAAFARQTVSSYFIEGSGVVKSRCINRVSVEVDDVGDVVLKYHWVPA